MIRKRWFYLFLGAVAIASFAFAACGDDDDDDDDDDAEVAEEATEEAMEEATEEPTEEEAAGAEPLEIQLEALNNSGTSGTASLSDNGDGTTTVVLALENAPGPHPVHIHSGTCETLGDVIYPLTDVTDGASETTVEAALADLQTGDFAINAHESAENIANYITCGNIPAA